MSVKIAKFHRMSERGDTSKFDQNPRLHEAETARTTSFKFSRAIEYELSQTVHLKSTLKGCAPYAPKSSCNEAHCENTPPRHTQRTEKNPPKRGESRAIKILPQQYTIKFRYKDRCGELKYYAQRAVNFIISAEQSLGYEFKFSRAINGVAAQAFTTRHCDEF